MSTTGARILVQALEAHGVECIFGVPGAAVLTLFDELYDAPIRTVLTRHEQGAGHMADGYARATGRPGVCIATSGPGATNLVTALATANADSAPVIAFTGQVKTHLIGNDAFQEADIVGITRPITKHNMLVRRTADLARAVREAFHIATTGRPGPVLVDLPADVLNGTFDGQPDERMRLPGYRVPGGPNPRQVARAVEAIDGAERPVLYVGGGVITSGASAELRALARKASIPVTTTLMGLGAFPEADPLSLGMLGMHGTQYANHAVTQCDVLIAVGARFDDRITGKLAGFAPGAQIVHVDIDPSSIGKTVAAHIPVVGDARMALAAMLDKVQPRERRPWVDQIADWKRIFPLTYERNGHVMPQRVIEQMRAAAGGRAICCTDVGQHQMWAAQYWQCEEPRTFLSSGGLGTMGFGLPAAIGAQLGRPDVPVVVITGDGSFQMNTQEMATACQLGLPLKIVLLNNGYLGMVRQWQELFFDRRYASTVLSDGNPDFVRLAESYGAVGIRVDTEAEVGPALDRAMAVTDRPVLLDVRTAPEANVFPMVPAGESIDRAITAAPAPAGGE